MPQSKLKFKVGQRRPGQGATNLLKERRSLFPFFFSPDVETNHTLIPPELPPSISQDCPPTPGIQGLQTYRVCPHTFTISFSEGFRYLVVLHRGQPWSSMASPLLWLFRDAGFSHCHLGAPPDPTSSGLLPTGTWPEWSFAKEPRLEPGRCSTNVPGASSQVPALQFHHNLRWGGSVSWDGRRDAFKLYTPCLSTFSKEPPRVRKINSCVVWKHPHDFKDLCWATVSYTD